MAMPPRPSWYSGREHVAAFMRAYLLTPRTRWRLVRTSANGQPAAAAYLWVERAGAFMPDCLHVLTLRGGEIEEITAFRSPKVFPTFGLPASIAA
jgi:RNA polymerase sigma-70 factor (ECF subfamily)